MQHCARQRSAVLTEPPIAARCTNLGVDTSRIAWSVARVCRNSSHGLVELELSPAANATDVAMVLRVGGPHPQSSVFVPAPNRRWTADFRVCRFGEYTLQILITNVAHNGSLASCFPRRYPCAIHHKHDGMNLRRFAWTHESDGERHSSPNCEACLWSWEGFSEADRAAASRLTNVTLAPHPRRAQLHVDYARLRFGHAQRNQALLASLVRAVGNSSAQLCLVGDSHMRNLNNRLAELQEAALARPPRRHFCDAKHDQNNHKICSNKLFRFVDAASSEYALWAFFEKQRLRVEGGSGRPASTADDGFECAAILFNVAHYVLSYKAPSIYRKYHDARWYENYINHLMGVASNFSLATHTPAAWLSANPQPLDRGPAPDEHPFYLGIQYEKSTLTRCPVTEFRFPDRLAELNRVAASSAARHRVPYVDAWPAIFDVFDLSFDAKHYQEPAASVLVAAALEWFGSALPA